MAKSETAPAAENTSQAAAEPRQALLQPHQVIFRPLVTEKGTHKVTRVNQYSFEVSPLASKDDIRHAIEKLFEVRVVKVRTQNRKGKPRRYRFKFGRTRDWKKALVTLHNEDRIDFF